MTLPERLQQAAMTVGQDLAGQDPAEAVGVELVGEWLVSVIATHVRLPIGAVPEDVAGSVRRAMVEEFVNEKATRLSEAAETIYRAAGDKPVSKEAAIKKAGYKVHSHSRAAIAELLEAGLFVEEDRRVRKA